MTMNWGGFLLLIIVACLAIYFVGLAWKEIDILKLICISVFLIFVFYIVISGFYFWADKYTIYRAMGTEGVCFLIGCLYFILKGKRTRFQAIWIKRDLILFCIILVGFFISYEKFDFFGMGQDEGVYPVKAIELIYGHEERQLDFEEYSLLETDEQKAEYAALVERQAGFDNYDSCKPTLSAEGELSPVSGIFHGIPTYPAVLALWGAIFGLENMSQVQSILFLCAMFFIVFTVENLKLKRVPTYLTVSLAAFCPVIHWVTKSTLTECGLYFIIAAFLYGITATEDRRAHILTVIAIWGYAFFHISTFAWMPLFVVVYVVLYYETGKKIYLRYNIAGTLGFWVGYMMMLHVSPVYSFNNINNTIGKPGDQYIIPIICISSAIVILFTAFLGRLPIYKFYSFCRQERVFTLLLRIVVIACLCWIALYAIRVYMGEVEIWKTDAQPYYEADTILPIIQHLGLTSMAIATGVLALPISVLLLLFRPREVQKTCSHLAVGVMFLYCVLLMAAFMKKEIYYFYYYARYLAPFIVVAVIGIGVLFNQMKARWVGVVLVGGLLVLLPFDVALATQKDDSRIEWDVLKDMSEQIEPDGAVVIDANDALTCMLPIKAMSNAHVYPLSADLSEQLSWLESQYDDIYFITNEQPDISSERLTYLYCNSYVTSQDLGEYTNRFFLLPTGFTQSEARISLMKYRGNMLEYDFASDEIELSGFDNVENGAFRWINGAEAKFRAYLAVGDYTMQITMGPGIPLQSLGTDSKSIDVYVNDKYADSFLLTKSNMNDSINISISRELLLESGVNTICFRGETWSPSEYGSGDTRELLFSIRRIDFQPIEIDTEYFFADEVSGLYGFDNVEEKRFRWMNQPKAGFTAYINQRDYSMEITLGPRIPLASLGIESYSLDVLVNGTHVTTLALTAETMKDALRVELPAELLKEGYNTIEFQGETWSPSEYGSGDMRNLLVAIQKISFIAAD